MQTINTPGVYFEALQPIRVEADLMRSDICAFIGYTEKGPTKLPIRIESWRQFLALFGNPLQMGHLAFAVKGFFENGGVTCYVVRITDQNALESRAMVLANNNDQPPPWKFYASFRVSDIVTNEAIETTPPDAAVVQNISPDKIRLPLPNPGAWGNNLSITVQQNSRLSTQIKAILDEGFCTLLDSLVGLELHSIVEISQEQKNLDGEIERIVEIIEIESIEHLRQRVSWKKSLLQFFNIEMPVRIDTVEFDISVFLENRQVEHFTGLGPHPSHTNSLHSVLAKQSQFINISYLGRVNTNWYQRENWPQNISQHPLQLGTDGVSEITAKFYLEALQMIAKVEDVGVLAAPDLVLSSEQLNIPVPAVLPYSADCQVLSAPGVGAIYGHVTDGVNNLFNVAVTDAESGQRAITDQQGRFQLLNLGISLRTLRLEKSGFIKQERLVFSNSTSLNVPGIFSLQALTIARHLTESEILEVQRAMSDPLIMGRYRVALLDPPDDQMKIEEIRSWRAKLGATDFAALFYPWLEAPSLQLSDNNLQAIPPCGHIAGLIARMDLEQGPHRTPANIKMRFAKAATKNINDVQQSILNPEGINVIRNLTGQGIRLYGARTLSSELEWRYLSVRRLVLALEKTLEYSMQWAVFEENNVLLRQAVLLEIRSLLERLWRKGALAGKTADAAFRIKCDADNNPQAQRDIGQLLAEIGIAPSVPLEFIYLRFDKTLDAIEVTE